MKRLILFATALFYLSSCSNIWIAPPYTSSEKIIGLKTSMSISGVNNQLGIPPFDVYHLKEDGSSVLVYNYRLKNRKVNVTSDQKMHNEESQTSGKEWYSKESYLLYVLFKDGKMQSAVTDVGRKDSEALMITNNTIQMLSKDEMSLFELAKFRYYFENGVYQDQDKSKSIIPLLKKK